MSYIGTNKVGKMYLGSTAIGKAYLGSDLVYDLAGGSTVLPYDTEIEYLQSSGTQYIDTRLSPTTNSHVIIECSNVLNASLENESFGYGVSGGQRFHMVAVANWNSNKFHAGCGTNVIYTTTADTASHTFELYGNGTFVQDGTSYSIGSSVGIISDTMPLFARLWDGSYQYSNGVRIHSFKWYESETLVLDLIPVRVGQVGYMYDKVSGQLLGNSGTGDFVLGGDIIGDGAYAQCDYVVPSSSSSIFTTGVTALGSEWQLDLQDAVTTSSNQVFICSNDNGGCFAAVNSSGKFSLGASNVMTSASTRTTVGIEFIDKGMIMTIGSTNTQRVGTYSHSQYVSLLGYNGKYLYQGKIYGIKCVSGGSFDAAPARRISDGVYGLYDTANDVFYTNFTGA